MVLSRAGKRRGSRKSVYDNRRMKAQAGHSTNVKILTGKETVTSEILGTLDSNRQG